MKKSESESLRLINYSTSDQIKNSRESVFRLNSMNTVVNLDTATYTMPPYSELFIMPSNVEGLLERM